MNGILKLTDSTRAVFGFLCLAICGVALFFGKMTGGEFTGAIVAIYGFFTVTKAFTPDTSGGSNEKVV